MPAGLGFTKATNEEAHVDRLNWESDAGSNLTGVDDKAQVQQEAQRDEMSTSWCASLQRSLNGNGHVGSPFADQHLDPKSDQLRAKDCARSLYDLRYSSEETIPRVAGVASKGLNVCGKGSPTDLQSTMGKTILEFPSLFGRGIERHG